MGLLPGLPSEMQLAATLEPLGGRPRAALDRLAQMRIRHVQLSALQPGLRPQDLDRSARRDLMVRIRRLEMTISGVDLWIPDAHYLDPPNADRAVEAALAAIKLAEDLGRCPVSLTLPADGAKEAISPIIETLRQCALRFGVELADHAPAAAPHEYIGVGIDPAAWLSRDKNPAAGVSAHAGRLASVRLCDLLTSGVRGPIGEAHGGRLDLLAYQVAIATSGYNRPVVVDARQWPDPWQGLEQTAHAWAVVC